MFGFVGGFSSARRGSRCWTLLPRTAFFLLIAGVLAASVLAASFWVRPAAATPKPPQQPERSLLASAFAAVDARDFDRAHRIADTLDDPLAAKVVRWFALTGQRRGGDFLDYFVFIERNPDWPWQRTLQHRAEGAMPSELPAAAVRAFFAERKPVSAYGAERYADALLDVEDMQDSARALLRHTWIEDDFITEDERRFVERYGHLLDEGLHRQRLDRLIWERNYTAAERQLDRVDTDHRRLGEARLRLARMESGVDAAIRRVPEHLRDHPGLLYERARWRQRRGRYEDTVELLDPPRPDAPHAELWWPLRHWTARMALSRGDISVAYRIAANHGLDKGVGFAQGEWLAGWLALRFLREPERAYPHFERLAGGVSTPVSLSRGAYWAGRAAEAMGDTGKAQAWYASAAQHLTAFYGQLAAARLDGSTPIDLEPPPAPGDTTQVEFDSAELVRAVSLLTDQGFGHRIDRLISHLADTAATAEEARLIADLAARAERQDLAVRVARQFRRSGIILADHLYPMIPLPDAGMAMSDSEMALVLSIVRQESGFNAEAVSRAGARGLMQLMPATAQDVAAELDLGYSPHRLLNDPDYNLTLGHAYLTRLIERYDGSLLLAVAAYNAGPARVSSWLNRFGDPRTDFVDPVDWIEMLPFAETRNYIQRIFEGMMVYRQRLAPAWVSVNLDRQAIFGESPMN